MSESDFQIPEAFKTFTNKEVTLKLLPLHDFVSMDLRQVLVESFLGFIFKNFEKLDFEDTRSGKILTQNS